MMTDRRTLQISPPLILSAVLITALDQLFRLIDIITLCCPLTCTLNAQYAFPPSWTRVCIFQGVATGLQEKLGLSVRREWC